MKRLARVTRNWRVSVGLAHESAAPSARLARSRARRALPGGRIGALEVDVEHILEVWNRHIPQLLTEIGEARRARAEVRVTQEDVARLEASVQELSARLATLSGQVSAPNPEAAGAGRDASVVKGRRNERSERA